MSITFSVMYDMCDMSGFSQAESLVGPFKNSERH